MTELFIREQQARVTELEPDFTIAAAKALPDDAWNDPHALVRLFYPLVLVGA